MKKIKAIQLIHGLSIGGAETLVKNYCLLFDKEKIDVVIVCLCNFHSMYDKEMARSGVRIIYIYDMIDSKVPGPEFVKKVLHRLLEPFVTKYVLKKEKPDVIHSHVLLNNLLEFAAPRNTDLYHTIHSDLNTIWNKSCIRQWDLAAAKRLVKNRNMHMIALHEEMKKQANILFQIDNTIVINNGVDVKKFQDAGNKSTLREKYGFERNTMICGHIGRFAAIKNHRFLIEIFAEIKKINKNAQLWLVGTGVLYEDIKKSVKEMGMSESVMFWGLREDIPQLLRMMDIIIMPSFKEGLSVTLIESQISGVPSLVSDTVVRETAISNLVHFYNLQNSASDWAKRALGIVQKDENVTYSNLNAWDMKKIVQRLEKTYEEGIQKT